MNFAKSHPSTIFRFLAQFYISEKDHANFLCQIKSELFCMYSRHVIFQELKGRPERISPFFEDGQEFISSLDGSFPSLHAYGWNYTLPLNQRKAIWQIQTQTNTCNLPSNLVAVSFFVLVYYIWFPCSTQGFNYQAYKLESGRVYYVDKLVFSSEKAGC